MSSLEPFLVIPTKITGGCWGNALHYYLGRSVETASQIWEGLLLAGVYLA